LANDELPAVASMELETRIARLEDLLLMAGSGSLVDRLATVEAAAATRVRASAALTTFATECE
jgi:hypothetical protein